MGNAVPDIPRLYTALAEWLSCIVFIVILKPRLKKWQSAGLLLLYLPLLMGFLYYTGTVPLWLWIPCMLAAFFSMSLVITACADVRYYESIFYAVMAFVIAECMASLEWQMEGWINATFVVSTYWVKGLALPGVYALVFVIMWNLIRIRMPAERALEITKRDWVTAVFIGVIVFGFSNLSFMTTATPFSGQTYQGIANARALVDVAGIAILYAYFLLCCENMVRRELDAVQKVLQNQYQQYELSKETVELINYKYHDMRYQIAYLRSERDPQKVEHYLDEMERNIKFYELQNKTGNAVLDTLLTSKSVYCSKYDITLTSVADGKLLDFMDTMDICSIFGNALDNAIECVMKIPETEKRLIHLTVSQVKGFVMIRLENYYDQEPTVREGKYKTTKNDPQLHGYGIKSIQYTADRYDGAVHIHAENHWFELKILIPFKG